MSTTNVSFYELPVTIGGIEWLLTCEDFSIHYSIQGAEPDVGIMQAYAEDVCIEDKTLILTGFYKKPHNGWTDDYTLVLQQGSYAFEQVEAAAMVKMQDAADEAATTPFDDDY